MSEYVNPLARNKKLEAKDKIWEYIDCPDCKGTGYIGGYKCRKCKGFGYSRKQK